MGNFNLHYFSFPHIFLSVELALIAFYAFRDKRLYSLAYATTTQGQLKHPSSASSQLYFLCRELNLFIYYKSLFRNHLIEKNDGINENFIRMFQPLQFSWKKF